MRIALKSITLLAKYQCTLLNKKEQEVVGMIKQNSKGMCENAAAYSRKRKLHPDEENRITLWEVKRKKFWINTVFKSTWRKLHA